MVDFRYLLVTVIAIFLALAVGIAVGAGFLGEPVAEGLKDSVRDVRNANTSLTDEVAELRNELEQRASFADRLEPLITDNVLAGRQFVMLSFDGTDGRVIDSVRTAVEEARAEIVTTVSFGDRLALEGQPDREQIASILGSVTDDPARLRLDLAERVGSLGAEAAGQDLQPGSPSARRRLNDLLGRLEEQGYAAVDQVDDGGSVEPGAGFLVVGGATSLPPFPVPPFAERLSVSIAREQGEVMAAESSDSVWGMVAAIRDSGEANAVVPTVDQMETTQGRIALVLGLRCPTQPAAHYGLGPDANALIPEDCGTE